MEAQNASIFVFNKKIMLNNINEVSIIVNGQMVDIYSMEKLNLRINNVVFNPVSIQTKTGEYSFSFELPATAKNNRIFNYANNSAKLNKFNTKYSCEVIADGVNIFTGILRLTDTQTKNYKCNLVNVKLYNVEEIFGDMVMSDLDWQVDFNGTPTINNVNYWYESGYYFPLACYGAFQKDPKATYNGEINEYTPLTQIDYYNNWYWESFHPSLSLLEVVKRLFKQRGYNVSGDIFNDKAMKMVYMSEYIDSSQDPFYNLNKPEIGDLHVAGSYSNAGMLNGSTAENSSSTSSTGRRQWPRAVIGSFQDLTFPKELVNGDTYQWDRICWFDVLGTNTGNDTHNFTIPPTNSYIFRQNNPSNTSGFIYIPSDGLYTIELTVSNVSIADEQSNNIWYKKKEWGYQDNEWQIIEREVPLEKNFDSMPVEIHLLRNSNETELISTVDSRYIMYPHEMDYTKYKQIQKATGGTVSNNVSTSGSGTFGGSRGGVSSSGRRSGNTSSTSDSTSTSTNRGNFAGGRKSGYTIPDEVYYTPKGSIVAYDPFANPNFICGFTTINNSPAVIKNGVSWNASVTDFNQSHYRNNGYIKRDKQGNETLSEYNKNTLNCPNTDYFSTTGTYTRNGKVTCVVELHKNDIIYLELVTRYYYDIRRRITHNTGYTEVVNDGTYRVRFDYDIKITPYTNKTDQYINTQNMPYLPSEEVKKNGWGTKLRLGNFLNCKEKASDFVNNFIKSFNLEYIQDGKNVILNKAKKVVIPLNYISIDDRVNTDNITFQRIDYPNSMQVKWSINEEEAGAYRSIDTVEHQGAPNWKDYIDRGSDKIYMDTTNESVDNSIDSKFAYTWYEDFTLVDYNRETFQENGHIVTLRMPIIAKDENFIVQNDEAMKHDGLSLKQRLWFRDQPTQDTLRMWNGDEVEITLPNDTYRDYVMNYKQEAGSMIDKYFNIIPMVDSNFAIVECYITPFEYYQLKNGCMVKVDDDLYIVSEITGFDPTGNNLTTLKLIKVVN